PPGSLRLHLPGLQPVPVADRPATGDDGAEVPGPVVRSRQEARRPGAGGGRPGPSPAPAPGRPVRRREAARRHRPRPGQGPADPVRRRTDLGAGRRERPGGHPPAAPRRHRTRRRRHLRDARPAPGSLGRPGHPHRRRRDHRRSAPHPQSRSHPGVALTPIPLRTPMPAFLKNKWLWIGLALLVAVVIGLSLMQKAGAAKKAELAEAAEKTVESPYSAIANGKIDIEGGIIQIAARRGGVVRDVLVQEGDLVKAGQILARQEDDEPRLSLQTATADLAQAESQLRMINVDIATAQREHDRLQKLVATNFVAAQRMDQARDAIAQAQARLASQQAAVQTARARRDQAAYNVELTVIRSPADGRIVRRYANPGAGASTLNVSNMFDLEPAAPRIARAEIVEADIPNVSVDQAVEITP